MGKRALILLTFLLLFSLVIFSYPIDNSMTNTKKNLNFQRVYSKLPLKISIEKSISDSSVPIITRPIDINYLVNTTGNTIEWYIADTNPGNYSVQHNFQFIDSHRNITWTENQSIVISIDNLQIGVHLYSILVEDSWGNEITDDVLVTVRGIVNEPNFNYTVPNPYNLSEFTEVLFIIGISLFVIILITIAIISSNRYRKWRVLFTDLPPKDPLELESFEDEEFI